MKKLSDATNLRELNEFVTEFPTEFYESMGFSSDSVPIEE